MGCRGTPIALHGRFAGPIGTWSEQAARAVQAYLDVGMRVTFAPLLRDGGLLAYDDEAFVAALAEDICEYARSMIRARSVPVAEQVAFSRALWDRWHAHPSGRVRIDFAPANIDACSGESSARSLSWLALLARASTCIYSRRAVKGEFARRRWGVSAVRRLEDVGALTSRLTIAHAVWVSVDDIRLLAERDVVVVHNPSSNLRLGSGVAPVDALRRSGVPVALGIDEAGLNDDHDVLSEMRLAYTLHRSSGGSWSAVDSADDVLEMVTRVGARSTGFEDRTGELAPGRQADLVVLDRGSFAQVGLPQQIPLAEQIVRCARPSAVRAVVVAGEVIYRLGRFTRINADDARRELAAHLARPLTDAEQRRAALAARLASYVARYYDNWGGT